MIYDRSPRNGWHGFDIFGLPRKAKEYLQKAGMMARPMGTGKRSVHGFDTELVAHLDNGIEVIFNLDGTFSREVDPYARPPSPDGELTRFRELVFELWFGTYYETSTSCAYHQSGLDLPSILHPEGKPQVAMDHLLELPLALCL